LICIDPLANLDATSAYLISVNLHELSAYQRMECHEILRACPMPTALLPWARGIVEAL